MHPAIGLIFRTPTFTAAFSPFFSPAELAISCEKAVEKLCMIMCVQIMFKSCGKEAENLRIWREKGVQKAADFLRESGGITVEKDPNSCGFYLWLSR